MRKKCLSWEFGAARSYNSGYTPEITAHKKSRPEPAFFMEFVG